jgi:hypothetical protein
MQKKLMLTNFGNQQLLKAIEEMRRLGILMNPPSKLGEFPLREFYVVGHTTLDSNELRHGDHWYLYENVGKKPLLVEVKWADSSGQSSETA